MNTASTSGAVEPPSAQEITRKLSLHSVAKPKVTATISTSISVGSDFAIVKKSNLSLSGNESDSDSVLSPDHHTPPNASALSGGVFAGTSPQPLSAIAERRSGSGEDSEEDDEDDEGGDWRTSDVKSSRKGSGDESVIKTGYLRKKGERRKTWKKRWFVLRPGHLAYYKTNKEYELHRLLDLTEVHACTPVTLKRHSNTFGLVSPTRTYYLQADRPEEVNAWVQAISEARETLMSISTQNSTTAPIPIPNSSSREATYAPTLTPSPPSHSLHTYGLTSSESEDASSNAPRSLNKSSNVRATFSSPQKSQVGAGVDPTKQVAAGYLLKCGSKRRNWRKRWFVLTGEQLVYSGSHMDTKPHRQIPLAQILDALEYDLPQNRVVPAHASPSLVTSPPMASSAPDETSGLHRKHTFKIVTAKRSLLLCAPSEEEEIKWLSAVRALLARRSGTGAVPGTAGGSNIPKSSANSAGSEIQQGHSASGSGSGSGAIKGMARRISVSAGSSGFSGNAVSEEGAPEKQVGLI